MGEEVKITYYDGTAASDDDRVSEWEAGLPTVDDLTPLSQHLIPPELASAFSITPGPHRSMVDVNRASQNTLSSLRGGQYNQNHTFNFKSFNDDNDGAGEDSPPADLTSDSRKLRKIDGGGAVEEADSGVRTTDNGNDDPSGRTQKRARLVWTPQLHKRFVDVVAHLGIKNAVPKTIMQLMNVEGLTRENVASHLQKYRLYLKRMQGLSNEGPSSSDHLFASTPVPQSLHEGNNGNSNNNNGNNGHVPMQIPVPYPMPVYGNHMGMHPVGNHPAAGSHNHGFESHPYNMFGSANMFGSYHHRITPNDK